MNNDNDGQLPTIYYALGVDGEPLTSPTSFDITNPHQQFDICADCGPDAADRPIGNGYCAKHQALNDFIIAESTTGPMRRAMRQFLAAYSKGQGERHVIECAKLARAFIAAGKAAPEWLSVYVSDSELERNEAEPQ
jgi:hypothetical protein